MDRQDAHFGSPTLPTPLRRARETESGHVNLLLDTEDHDRELIRALAEAVRADDEVAALLARYAHLAEAMDDIETGATPNNRAERAALTDEVEDILADLDRALDRKHPGEGLVVPVSPGDTARLAGMLVRVVARRVVEGDAPLDAVAKEVAA